jgi:hypothetical protein
MPHEGLTLVVGGEELLASDAENFDSKKTVPDTHWMFSWLRKRKRLAYDKIRTLTAQSSSS